MTFCIKLLISSCNPTLKIRNMLLVRLVSVLGEYIAGLPVGRHIKKVLRAGEIFVAQGWQ
jgi:hypothetical protein